MPNHSLFEFTVKHIKAPEIHSSGLFVHFSELIQLNGAKVFILAAPKSMFSFVGIYFFNCLTIKN